MKKFLLAIAIVFLAMPAWAQDDGGGMPSGAPAGQGQGQGQGQGGRFEARKAQILDRLHQTEACVQAATDPQSLRSCRPNPGPGGGGQRQGMDRGAPPQDAPPNGGDDAPPPDDDSDSK